MIYERDWLMRQIEAMVLAIVSFLLRKSGRSGEEAEVSDLFSASADLEKRDRLTAFLEKGEICPAEDWLFEHMDSADISWLKAAVFFYSQVNKFTDEYLAAHNFSREEAASGLAEACGMYGLGAIAAPFRDSEPPWW